MTLKQRFTRFLILSAIGLLLGAAIACITLLMDKSSSPEQATSSNLLVTSIGGPFTLVDQDGKTRTDKDFADKIKLIYFGFASCPAICPTELQRIADIYKALPPELQKRVQPMFITIDPERDTPHVLKGYVDLFLPNMVGLTGSAAQIEAVKSAYKVYGVKVKTGEGKDDYTVDHSSFIYLQTPKGRVVAMFKPNESVADMTARVLSIKDID